MDGRDTVLAKRGNGSGIRSLDIAYNSWFHSFRLTS
jgi:hypothetical protein